MRRDRVQAERQHAERLEQEQKEREAALKSSVTTLIQHTSTLRGILTRGANPRVQNMTVLMPEVSRAADAAVQAAVALMTERPGRFAEVADRIGRAVDRVTADYFAGVELDSASGSNGVFGGDLDLSALEQALADLRVLMAEEHQRPSPGSDLDTRP
jgi:hypothetical protein